MMTTKRIANGQFEVLWNGEPTKYSIINGSLGLSGRNTQNHYGITSGTGLTWVGTLQAAKKLVRFWLEKQARGG